MLTTKAMPEQDLLATLKYLDQIKHPDFRAFARQAVEKQMPTIGMI